MGDINVHVKTMQPAEYSLSVPSDLAVPDLKARVAEASGVPADRQRIIFRGHVLRDSQKLSDHGVEDGHTLHMVERPPDAPDVAAAGPASTGRQGAAASSAAGSGNQQQAGGEPVAGANWAAEASNMFDAIIGGAQPQQLGGAGAFNLFGAPNQQGANAQLGGELLLPIVARFLDQLRSPDTSARLMPSASYSLPEARQRQNEDRWREGIAATLSGADLDPATRRFVSTATARRADGNGQPAGPAAPGGGGAVLRGNSALAAAFAVALGHLLRGGAAAAGDRLLPAMNDAARRLSATADAEPQTLRNLAGPVRAVGSELYRAGALQWELARLCSALALALEGNQLPLATGRPAFINAAGTAPSMPFSARGGGPSGFPVLNTTSIQLHMAPPAGGEAAPAAGNANANGNSNDAAGGDGDAVTVPIPGGVITGHFTPGQAPSQEEFARMIQLMMGRAPVPGGQPPAQAQQPSQQRQQQPQQQQPLASQAGAHGSDRQGSTGPRPSDGLSQGPSSHPVVIGSPDGSASLAAPSAATLAAAAAAPASDGADAAQPSGPAGAADDDDDEEMPPLLSEPDTASDGDVPPLINNEDMEDVDDDDYDDDEDYDEDGPQEQGPGMGGAGFTFQMNGPPNMADLNAFVPHLAQQFTEMLQQHGALPGGTGGGRGGAGAAAGRGGGGPATGGPGWDALRSIVATVANAIGPAVAAAASSQEGPATGEALTGRLAEVVARALQPYMGSIAALATQMQQQRNRTPQGGAAGGGRGRGRVARRRTGGPGAAGGDAPAAGADEGDDDGGEWAYINTTHIVADITVEEVPSPEPAASGGSAGGARPGETTSAQGPGALPAAMEAAVGRMTREAVRAGVPADRARRAAVATQLIAASLAGQNVTAMAAAHGVTPAELLAATRAVGRSGSFPAGGWVDRQTPTPPPGVAAAAGTAQATAALVPASSQGPGGAPADQNSPPAAGTFGTGGDGGAAAAPAEAQAEDSSGSAEQAAPRPSQAPQTGASAPPAGAGRGLGTALPRRRARGAGSMQSRDIGATAAPTATPPSRPVTVPASAGMAAGPPGLGGLLGMLGGSGGGGAGGGGAGLAAALNSMLQSPQMQALATQLESASNGTARVPSSVAVEERHADDGDATMPDAPSADSAAVTFAGGGGGGGGGGGQQPGFAQMLGAVMQSPALRQIADDPEMQRAARQLSGGDSGGPPLDMGALFSRMMPVVSEVMGGLGGPPGRTGAASRGPAAITPVTTPADGAQRSGSEAGGTSGLRRELRDELGDEALAARWAATIEGDRAAMAAAPAARELSEAYRAGAAPQGGAAGGGGLFGNLL